MDKKSNNSVDIKLKAKKIKLIAFDVDGVLTDASFFYLDDGSEIKKFNAKDGLGIVMMKKAGFKTALITASNSTAIKRRGEVLDIDKVYLGQKNKVAALDELCQMYDLTYDEIMYMGDDYPDMEVLKLVGMSVCPNDAIDDLKDFSDFVTQKNGGCGAVREVCDFIMNVHGITFEDIKKPYQQ